MKTIFIGLVFLILSTICIGKTEEKVVLDRARAEILWDTWGVPHIYAESFEATSYAFGYAQARDHGALLARMIFLSSGRASELGGQIYEPIDTLVYSLDLIRFSEEFYNSQDPSTVAALDNFAEGVNAFAEKYPDEFGGPWNSIFPVSGLDVFKANLRVLYTFAFSGSGEYETDFRKEYGEDPLAKFRNKNNMIYSVNQNLDPFQFMEIPENLRHLIGSNAWAINSKGSRSNGPKMVQNPHLPYLGFFRWYEAQIICESCGIDIYGAGLIATPNLQIAFNKYLGWTHTVNPGRPYTGYVVDLASENSYHYDGEVLPITQHSQTFKIKQRDGSYTEKTIVNEYTHHGQVISRGANQILVKRLAGFNDLLRPDAIKQWWDMGKAKSLEEFNDAMRQLQVPMFYTVVATRDDDIMLNFNGWVPDRNGLGDWDYWGKAVNGSTSETFWTKVHSWDELPTIINPESGFVQNANEPPWAATLPVFTLNPDEYPKYMAPTAHVSYRSQVSLRLMSTNFNITFDELVTLKHSTFKEASVHSLESLIEAIDNYGNSEEIQEAREILSKWDGYTDSDSVGAVLFETWLNLSPGSSQLYEVPWDPSDPINTPHTLASPRESVRTLEKAMRRMRLLNRPLNITWGETNKLFVNAYSEVETIPGNGCRDCFRNGWYVGTFGFGGDSWVAVVEWDKDGIVSAEGLIGYGNASPGSKARQHIHDQNYLFAEKKLRVFWRTRAEVESNLEEYAELFV